MADAVTELGAVRALRAVRAAKLADAHHLIHSGLEELRQAHERLDPSSTHLRRLRSIVVALVQLQAEVSHEQKQAMKEAGLG